MTRRALRECIFRILFKVEFNSMNEMQEQIRYSIASIEDLRVEELDEDGLSIMDIIAEPISEEDTQYITDKANAIIDKKDDIDTIIEKVSDGWTIDRIGKTELAILRVAIYEMLYDEDIPYKAAINEAVELTKKYCDVEAKGFVNALLGKVEK